MKKIFPALIVAAIICFGCGPTIYKSQDFESKTASHKIVAILPAEVSISLRPNEMKKTSMEQLNASEEKTGLEIQDKMYTWFLKRSNKFKYTVTFQDISKTNAILLQNGIGYGDMRAKTKDELARLLNVDAVISTRADMKKPMSEGAAVAVGLLVGAWGSTNNIQTTISINEAKQGDLVWKYDYHADGSVGSSTTNLVNALMRNASKKFPYNDK
ncbi:MAG: hypothetical protein ABI091_28540 [Ferruginibacter sp.]